MGKNPLRCQLFLVFTLCLAACVPTSAPAEAFSTVTEPPKTLIPARLLEPPLELTPAAETIRVTTRAGQSVQLNSIRLEPNEYVAFHTESAPTGIPLESGVEISFQYLAQVEFDEPSSGWESGSPAANWPVTLTLTDGRQISGSLGFKARHQIHVVGETAFGPVDLQLVDVHSLSLQHAAHQPIPTTLSGTELFTLQTLSGESLQVADPRIFTNCMYNVYCCHYDDLTSLPLQSADLPLSALQSLAFSETDQVQVSLRDGTSLQTRWRPSRNCPSTAWRIRGRALLGDFESELAAIQAISR
jgi:hypothetical protein